MAKTLKGNCVLAQSGGPTAVINSSIAGAIKEAFRHPEIKKVYGAVNGILGVLNEEMIDLGKESTSTIELLRKTPSSALGSCRYKLKGDDYERILKVLEAHNIRYFIMNGGNDSMDTADKVDKLAEERGYMLRVMGIPKTVDNDLAYTDHSPGYGSVARWLAIAVRDAGLDTAAIYTSDTVKVIETMGRNAGWITASTALAREHKDDPPNLIYLPEKPFNEEKFIADVDRIYKQTGRVVITVCEGLRDEKGEYLTASSRRIDTDGFGHKQLGGVSDVLCSLIADNLNLKARFDKPGTIQRVSILCASGVDLCEAYLAGKRAVRHAVRGESGKMITLERVRKKPYRCTTGLVELEKVANAEKKVPDEYINEAGNDITEKFLEYAFPLIGGSLPRYARLKKLMVKKLL
ncbi:MAG: 6-phosphofructokinase [bacterium]